MTAMYFAFVCAHVSLEGHSLHFSASLENSDLGLVCQEP